jgi:hypothetical protein
MAKRTVKTKMKKMKCPQCNNDPKLKPKCIVCRGDGWVYTGKSYDPKA